MQLCSKPRGARGIKARNLQKKGSALITSSSDNRTACAQMHVCSQVSGSCTCARVRVQSGLCAVVPPVATVFMPVTSAGHMRYGNCSGLHVWDFGGVEGLEGGWWVVQGQQGEGSHRG